MATPATSPSRTGQANRRNTAENISARLAPSASRIAISFVLLRHGIADKTEKANDCEENRNAAQQADDRRNLLHLGDILAKAGCERGNGWIESGVDAASNRLDGWRAACSDRRPL